MDWKIPLFKIYWDEQDVEMVVGTIRTGMSWATGSNIQEFERMLAGYVGTKYAVVLNSGTSALHAVLVSCDIGEGDEVIVPSFTFIATANAPLFVGARPVFADIEEKTYGLDPKDVEGRITPMTKAIIPVHYGGSPCLIHELERIAERHNLLLIEDAAESLGAAVDGKKVGSFGDCAIFSFCAPKVITTGEGGAVVTDSADVYERLKLVRSHGRAETADYFTTSEYLEYMTLGYNFRMSNITAALGIAQLSKIDKIIQMRKEKAARLTEKLSRIEGVSLPTSPNGFLHLYQMYTIRVGGGKEQRDGLMVYLNKRGIAAKVYFEPVHHTQFYRDKLGYEDLGLPVTERVSQQVLTLPMYPSLTDDEIEYIVDEVSAFFSLRNKSEGR